jgi:hypothetical protein
MPCRIPLHRASLLLAALVFSACHGGGSKKHAGGPPTQIDLTVTAFQVSPGAADAQDTLLLTGTLQNIGAETANPLLGDQFQIRFNLSTDGTLELNEVGFLEGTITDPIPPGATHDFSFSGPMGAGDTLLHIGNFCEPCSTPPCLCVPPQTGVLGVKVDSADDVAELDEANNFKFIPIEVIGTRVSAVNHGCEAGTIGGGVGSDGCDLLFSDEVDSINAQHRPCSNCTPTDQMFPNELHTAIRMTMSIQGCQTASCGGSWDVTATKDKVGQVTTFTQRLSCSTNGNRGGCAWCWDLTDGTLRDAPCSLH